MLFWHLANYSDEIEAVCIDKDVIVLVKIVLVRVLGSQDECVGRQQ